MAEVLKVLGQASPAAATVAELYAVPASKQVTTSTFVVCNRNSTKIKFRIAVAIGGVPDSPEQYLYWDWELLGHDTFAATLGVTLATLDKVRVYADSANVNFHLYGAEVDQ